MYLGLSQSVSVFDGEAKSRGERENGVLWESGGDLKNRGLNSNNKQKTKTVLKLNCLQKFNVKYHQLALYWTLKTSYPLMSLHQRGQDLYLVV